jgi:ssDNA-binding Zn-finger/Zn-ribbon topoisomerase 1
MGASTELETIMLQSKGNDRPAVRECPVCHHPQTKIQRRLNGAPTGATVYVCARADECTVGMNLSKIETWVAV